VVPRRVLSYSGIYWDYFELCNVAVNKFISWECILATINRFVIECYRSNFKIFRNFAFSPGIPDQILKSKFELRLRYNCACREGVNFN
jgi:hypothetical protein